MALRYYECVITNMIQQQAYHTAKRSTTKNIPNYGLKLTGFRLLTSNISFDSTKFSSCIDLSDTAAKSTLPEQDTVCKIAFTVSPRTGNW